MRELRVESLTQEVADRLDTEGPDHDPVKTTLREGALEIEQRPFTGTSPESEKGSDALLLEAAEGKLQDAGRRGVEPLQIVDRDQDGRIGSKRPQRPQYAERNCPLGEAATLRFGTQQRDAQSALLRVGKRREGIIGHAFEQVTKRGERKLRLGFDRTGDEDTIRALLRHGEACLPEAALPDPDLSLEPERDGFPADGIEEARQCRKLVLPPEDLTAHAIASLDSPDIVLQGSRQSKQSIQGVAHFKTGGIPGFASPEPELAWAWQHGDTEINRETKEMEQ